MFDSYPHEKVLVDLDDRLVKIDKEFANLIIELNKIGLKTNACCSGSKRNSAYISFELGENITFDFEPVGCILTLRIHKNDGERQNAHIGTVR